MNMSFMLTPNQYKNHSKIVTRRNGWKNLKRGQILNGVDKTMGFKKGEKPVVFGRHVIYSCRWEPLRRMIDEPEYGKREVIREGFPDWDPQQFVDFYCRHSKITPETEVNRIAFRHIRPWNNDGIPDLPDWFMCPICEDHIQIEEITGMIECEKTGLWIADEIHVDCVSAPDIDSEEWDDWFHGHWSMPYVDWLPVDEKVKSWLKLHYRFFDEDLHR